VPHRRRHGVRSPAVLVGVVCAGWLVVGGAAAEAELTIQNGELGRPAHQREVPVLLVPGWLDSSRDLAALRIRLLASGHTNVRTITFRDPVGSNRDHAQEIDSAVTKLLIETDSEQVDLVAHSMGGLAVRWYLLTRSPTPVRRVAFLASPHRGTLSAHLAWGDGGEEMTPGSSFLDSLNSRAPRPEGIEAITIRTPLDTHVVPGESATLPAISDHVVCCPSHAGLLHDDEVFGIVLAFLEDPPPASAGQAP